MLRLQREDVILRYLSKTTTVMRAAMQSVHSQKETCKINQNGKGEKGKAKASECTWGPGLLQAAASQPGAAAGGPCAREIPFRFLVLLLFSLMEMEIPFPLAFDFGEDKWSPQWTVYSREGSRGTSEGLTVRRYSDPLVAGGLAFWMC
ncbi:Hypothetical predicted protein [Marmota monax]|uniref:Uncharacterized protein n=1 Tax=Marmota monax TaxID=9995 RepID=A0A5E4AGY1_MARMO|nr:hypothetical protein GHT09_018802 [Marmota monax]VTJ56627.1 Hypothetical predicted protein [Marmota monax]